MREFDAHRTWLAYRGLEAFAFGLGWTVAPVFFVRELDFSPLQLVLAGTALEMAYFFFEIPTGIVADTYGRRLSVILGTIGLAIGFIATGLANGVWLVLVAAAFMGFAWTFKSGADEAWVTDEVGVQNAARTFQAGAQAMRIGSLVGIGAAVGLALVDLRLPIVTGGVVMLGTELSSLTLGRDLSGRALRLSRSRGELRLS
jgi:MFS transporter, DHA3 family, tetracycline resistance protein